MENLFMLFLLASLFLLITGLISPKTSLFWYKKERTRKISTLIYGLSLIVSFALFGMAADKKTPSNQIPSSRQEKSEAALTQKQNDSIAESQKQQEFEDRKKITITAGDLVSYYSQNEVKADGNFKGKSFYVVGYAEHIGKDIMDNTYVTLKSSDGIRSVQCFVEDQDVLAKLQTGQKITLYGECDGLMMNVLMKNCKVVDNIN